MCVASSKWILHRLSRGQVIFHHWDQIGKNPHNQVDTPKRHRQVGLDEPHLLFLVPSIPVRWVGLILPSQVDLSYIELNLAAGDKTEKPNNLSLLLSHTSCQKHTRVQFSRGILWTMTKSPCNCFEWAFQHSNTWIQRCKLSCRIIHARASRSLEIIICTLHCASLCMIDVESIKVFFWGPEWKLAYCVPHCRDTMGYQPAYEKESWLNFGNACMTELPWSSW